MLFRQALGQVLRRHRREQGRTLRELSADAKMSLGYISELERGVKEGSSELLSALCTALDVPLSQLLQEVTETVAAHETATAPVPLPVPGRPSVVASAA